MIRYSSKYRSNQAEIMDDFQFQGQEMKEVLTDLKNINKWLGGNQVTLDGLAKLLKDHPKNKEIRIVDLGCGDGSMLRQCADYGKQNGYNFKLVGLDANQFIVDQAEKLSFNYENILFQKIDVISKQNSFSNYDIALCTLFLHHLNEIEILKLLSRLISNLKLGIIVNDLERNRLAFVLYKLISFLFIKTKTASHDGLVSIARGFKKSELKKIAESLDISYSLKWKWAFRYQFILRAKNN